MLKGFLISLLTLFSFTLLAQLHPMYVGTYTANGSKGINVYDFDERTGETHFVKSITMNNPSFLARKGDLLYAVNEEVSGTVTAYNIKEDQFLSTLPTNGAHPCHVSISPIDSLLVVSNYSGGSVVLYSIAKNGSLNKQEDFIQFNKSSINKKRQEKSHIHSAFFSADGAFLFVSDLGGDLIYKIGIEKKESGYSFNIIDEIKVKPGGGPRHVVVNTDGSRLYSVLEMTGEIEVLENENSNWISKQIVPIYSDGFVGEHGGGDIKMSADGKYLYATNRGESNEIVVYKVGKNGLLSLLQVQSVEGISPRNIQLSPDEKWIIVSNQINGALSIFPRNQKNGKLQGIAKFVEIPSSVCTIF